MKKKIIVATIIVFMFFVGLTLISIFNAEIAPKPMTSDELFKTINDWRTSNNFPAYKTSKFLCNIADIRLKDIKESFDEKGFTRERLCPNEKCNLGESYIKGQTTPQGVLNTWLNSRDQHIRLTLPVFTKACVATDGNYTVMIFGDK